MKHLKSIAQTALLIFVSLVIGFNLYSWNARSLMGNAMPMPFGYGAAVVLSGSMEPTLLIDDLIIVAESDDYTTGDIVVYQSGSMLVVHRVIEMGPDTLVTQGDANNAPDAPVRKEMIKGKMIACIPGIGRLVRLLKSPAASFALVAVALFVSELSFRKDKQKDQEKLEQLKEEIRRLKAEQE